MGSSARKASCGVVALSGQSRLTRLTCPSTVARPTHRPMPALLVAAPFCLISAWVVAADGASRGPLRGDFPFRNNRTTRLRPADGRIDAADWPAGGYGATDCRHPARSLGSGCPLA